MGMSKYYYRSNGRLGESAAPSFPTKVVLFVFIFWNTLMPAVEAVGVTVNPAKLFIKVNVQESITIELAEANQTFVQVQLIVGSEDLRISSCVLNATFGHDLNQTIPYVVNVTALEAGYSNITFNESTHNDSLRIEDVYVQVTAYYLYEVTILIDVVGWIYVASWSLSFYPQMWKNYRRKSVVGFSFDFLSLNLIGHACYLFFNAGLYWIPAVENMYFSQHPHGVNPVQLNDVLFSIHAVAAVSAQVLQCCIYERNGQRVSTMCRLILAAICVFIVVCLGLTHFSIITWLSYLYFFSYIKLGITVIKYCPQVYSNFKRRSTDGWSIGYSFCDFIGGINSIVQMFLIAYDYNDWGSISGDPTKLGLGLVSISFDCVFMVQHFWLYRNKVVVKKTDNYSDNVYPDSVTYM